MDEFNLENCNKLLEEIKGWDPPIDTQFDHLCYIGKKFLQMMLEQKIAELRIKAKEKARGRS